MTWEELTERATLIRQRLVADVEAIAPKGIGRWDRTWDIVGGADAAFMAAESAWVCDPTNEAAKEGVRTAYAAVLTAWRAAVAEFERQGAER